MEYQKIINLLNNTPNQPAKFRTRNWIEINDNAHRTYNTNSQIKFKILMLRSIICDNSDTYILAKGTVSIARVLAPAQPENVGKKVVFNYR